MANVTKTTAAVFIPEMWRDAILDYAERRFQLKSQVTDFSAMLSGGGDILNIPKVKEETAVELGAGAEIAYTAQTDTNIALAVDQHWLSAKRIDDVVKVQESTDLFNMYAQSMGYALAKKVESYLATLIQTAAGNDVTLAADDTFTTALLRDGLEKFLDAGHDYADGGSNLYCSPKAYMSLLSLGDFSDAQVRGDSENPNVRGTVMQAYGLNVYSSTDWAEGGTADTASIFKKEAVYFAQQISPRVQSGYDMNYLATRVVADVMFGAALSHATNSTAAAIVNFKNPA